MADHDSWTDAQSGAPVKKRMSGCMLASLIVGGIGLVVGLVCCGGGVWLAMSFKPTISNSPQDVAAVAKQILDFKMIDGFNPAQSVTMDNWIFTMRIAEFKHMEGKGEMMIGKFFVKIGDPNQAKMQSQQFRGPMESKMQETVDIKKTEHRDITINGKTVMVSISEGTDRNDGKSVHIVSGDFDQAGGKAFFLIRLDDEIWDEAAVLKMFEEAKP